MSEKIHVTVAAVAQNQGRYLLVEERIDGQLVVNQPAGHLEPDESLLEAVIRETKEETAQRFTPEYLVGVYCWRRNPGDTFIRFTFAGSIQTSEQPVLDPEIESVLWLNYQQLCGEQHRLRSPLVVAAVRDHRAGRRYPLDCLKDLVSATL
jgi:8-oxo-dGTP pyrophosphatase MutT (NUDIX family)